MAPPPREFPTAEACVDQVIATVGPDVVLGAPLGLGKPNQLLNAFYRRALVDPGVRLTIYTALSLERPRAGSDLEARFLDPYIARHFGDYVELDYMRAIRDGTLPPNVIVMDDPKTLVRSLVRAFTHGVDEAQAAPYLRRLGLEHPHTPKDVVVQHLLLLELEDHGYLRGA
jgi:hypothetical protein